MNVYYNAFSSELKDAVGVSVDGFWMSLCSRKEPLEIKYNGETRVITGHAFKGMFCLLIATARDDRYLPTIRRGSDGWLIEASELEEGQSLVEFNVCTVCWRSGTGLYMEYKNSLRLNAACELFGRLYRKYAEGEEKLTEVEVRRDFDDGRTSEAHIKREIRRRCSKGKVSFRPLVSKESFQAILADAQRINTLTYDVIDPSERRFCPQTGLVRSVKKVIRFDASLTSEIREWIGGVLKTPKGRRQLDGASLAVVTGEDNSQTIYVGENRLPMEVGDYDEVKLALADVKEMSRFHRSRVIETMRRICRRKAAIFGKAEDNDMDDA